MMRWMLPVMLAGASVGCMPTPKSSPPPRPRPVNRLDNLDPCASRLHDICEPLLLFHATYHRLPNSLDELRALGGFENMIYTCPVSGLTYIYNPAGISAPPGNAGAK